MNELIKFLKERFPERVQMFNTENIVGDDMVTIYCKDDIIVDYCEEWEYVEIFGLTEDKFYEVMREVGE